MGTCEGLCPGKITTDMSWELGGFGGLWWGTYQGNLRIHTEQRLLIQLCPQRQNRSCVASWLLLRIQEDQPTLLTLWAPESFPSVMLKTQQLEDFSLSTIYRPFFSIDFFWTPIPLLASWADYLTSWSIRYLICKMWIIIDTTSWDCCGEGWMKWRLAWCLALCQALKWVISCYHEKKSQTKMVLATIFYWVWTNTGLVSTKEREGMHRWKRKHASFSKLQMIVSDSWWYWCSSDNGRDALSDTFPTP